MANIEELPTTLADIPAFLQIGSLLIKALNKPNQAPDVSQVWIYSPRPRYVLGTPEVIDELVAKRWCKVPAVYQTSLHSQMHETICVQPISGEELQLWTSEESASYVERYPVALVSEINFPEGAFTVTQPIAGMYTIRLLNPLPLFSHGEGGFILDLNKPDAPIHGYRITNLPKESKARFATSYNLLNEIANNCKWIPERPLHFIALDPFATRRELNNLITREHLTYGETRKRYTEGIAQLKQAYEEISQIIEMQEQPNYTEKVQEARQLMQDLAKDYTLFDLSQRRSAPDIVDVFNTGIAEVFTHQPFQAYPAAAIARKKDWHLSPTEKENELILSFQRKKPSGTTYVQFRQEVTDEQNISDELERETATAKLWKQAKDLSDLDADVYLALVAQLLKGVKDDQGNTWITAQQILGYRGIKPKINRTETGSKYIGGHRWEDIEDIATCIKRMEGVIIKIHEQEIIDSAAPAPNKRKRPRKTISLSSRLFMFGDTIEHNTLPLEGPSKTITIAWQYRQSSWMVPFLEGPNRFTGLLFQKVLNFDPYHEKWEKRLSLHFMYWLRTNASREKKPALTVGDLLKENNLDIDEDRPQRTRDRFEKAMNRLQQDDMLTWRYKEEIQLPARKWFPSWLAQQVIVEDPPIIKNQYISIKATAKAARSQTQKQQKKGGKQ